MKVTEEQYGAAKKVVAAWENRKAEQFYEDELKANEYDELADSYAVLIKFLYGENKFSQPLHDVLGITQQITYSQFCILFRMARERKIKLLDILLTMENDKKYTKGKKSLFLTLHNWITQRFVKKYE